MEIEIGKLINKRYRVEKYLGRGGMSEVYKVLDTMRSTPLAMKVLHADLAEDIVFVRRFKREAQTLAKLQHPNIVRFYGFEQVSDTAMILMEYVDGTTLRNLISREKKPFTTERVLEILKPICAALHYAHQMGMVHCDVKPANIMIKQNGEVLLADFGIARLAESSSTATMVGSGTPAYMSPEQIRGENPTPQTDIYALGSVLYELFTGGERPFTGDEARTTGTTAEKVRWEKMNLEAPSPRKYNKGLSPSLEGLILRCLAHHPRDRFMSVMELLQALEKDSHGEMGKVPNVKIVEEVKPPEVKASKPISTKSGKPILIGAGAILLVTILLVAGITLITKGRTGKITENKVETQIVIEESNEPDQVTPTIPVTPTIMPGSEVISASNINRLGIINTFGPPLLNELRISPDGSFLYGATSGGVTFYDPTDLHEIKTILPNDIVSSVAISPDLLYLAVGISDRSIKIVQIDEENRIYSLSGHQQPILGLEYTSDGRELVSASAEKIIVWNTNDYSKRFEVPMPENISRMVLSPVNHIAATITGPGINDWWDSRANNSFMLWDLLSGKLIVNQKVYNGAVTDISFLPDGTRFITGDGSGRIDEWRINDFLHIRNVATQNEWVTRLKVSPDGKLIITSSNTKSMIRIFNYSDGVLRKGLSGGTDEILVSSDASILYSADASGAFNAWKVSDWSHLTLGIQKKAFSCTDWFEERCLYYDSDGLKLAALSLSDQIVSIIQLSTGEVVDTYKVSFKKDYTYYLSQVENSLVLVEYNDKTKERINHDLKTNLVLSSGNETSSQDRNIIYEDANRILQLNNKGNSIEIVDKKTNTLIHQIIIGAAEFQSLYTQAVSDRYISLLSYNTGTSILIDMDLGTLIPIKLPHPILEFSNNMELAVYSDRSSYTVIEIPSGKTLLTIPNNYTARYYTDFHFSKNDDLLMIFHNDWRQNYTLEFWDIANSQLVSSLDFPITAYVQKFYDSDGKRISLIFGSQLVELGIR